MSGPSCPKCGCGVAEDDVFCPACDCVLDVQQVLDEAEGTAEIDILAIDEGDEGDDGDGGEEVLFDPDADEPAIDDAGGPPRLDADLAAELAQVLEDGTGTVELGDASGVDADALDAASLFDDPDASAEGEPVPPPVFDGEGPYGGAALIVGDVAADAGSFESMLSDATGAITLDGCIVEPAPVYVSHSVQQLTAPNAVLGRKGAAQRVLPQLSQLSQLERHVLGFIDGKRPVLRVARKAGLSVSDAAVALGLLADRGLVELVGHATLRGAPARDAPRHEAPAPASAPMARAAMPFSGDLALEDPPPQMELPPMELPLDALTPLELPADALTPVPQPPQTRPEPSPFDDEASPVRPAAPTGGVRPALSLRPATAATSSRAALTVKDIAPPAAPPPPAGPRRPAASTMTTTKRTVDPTAQARAMQLIEVALKELREGRKSTALAWVKMAAELVPGDPKIEGLLASWGGTPGAIVAAAATGPATPKGEGQDLLAQARSLEAAGDAQGAANAYRRALKLNPSDPELYNRLGIVLALRLKDLIGATAALKKALEFAPTNLAYRSNLGKVVKMAAGEKLADDALYGGDEAHKLKPTAPGKPSSFLDRLKGLHKR